MVKIFLRYLQSIASFIYRFNQLKRKRLNLTTSGGGFFLTGRDCPEKCGNDHFDNDKEI